MSSTTSAVRPARAGAPPGALERVPPHVYFVGSAIFHYLGPAFAVLLFARVDALGVAWLRIASAAVVFAAWRRPWRTVARLDGAGRRLLLAWGAVLAVMNCCFYLAIDRLPLGTAVAIEFCGPTVVAALGSRGRRDAVALALAALGVVALADVHLAGSPGGVAFAAGAGLLWSGYIVLGHRVAADDSIRPQDGLAAGMAVGALGLAPALAPVAGPAFVDPAVLAACIAVGLASSVVPYALEQIAMRRLPRARFALLLALLPATAAIVGAVVLGQVPGIVEAVGILLVVSAAGLRTHEA